MITYTQTRSGNTTVVTAASTLTGPVYFYWYLDGQYLGFNVNSAGSATRTFLLAAGDQSQVDVLDSADAPDVFDPAGQVLVAWPATRQLIFTRSIDPTVTRYLVEQKQGAGSWMTLGYLQDDRARWQYFFTTPRLVDLDLYQWRVTPLAGLGGAGNAGTPLVLAEGLSGAAETIVRTPDAPAFTLAFDPATTKVTFAEAA